MHLVFRFKVPKNNLQNTNWGGGGIKMLHLLLLTRIIKVACYNLKRPVLKVSGPGTAPDTPTPGCRDPVACAGDGQGGVCQMETKR